MTKKNDKKMTPQNRNDKKMQKPNDKKMTKINNQQPSEFAGKIFIMPNVQITMRTQVTTMVSNYGKSLTK